MVAKMITKVAANTAVKTVGKAAVKVGYDLAIATTAITVIKVTGIDTKIRGGIEHIGAGIKNGMELISEKLNKSFYGYDPDEMTEEDFEEIFESLSDEEKEMYMRLYTGAEA